jgi:hypothetical protein
VVQPALEEIAFEEITHDLHGDVKRTGHGVVVFRVPQIEADLLRLRTAEDVFLLAWGIAKLSYRAGDVDRTGRWTAHEVDWHRLAAPAPRGSVPGPRGSRPIAS